MLHAIVRRATPGVSAPSFRADYESTRWARSLDRPTREQLLSTPEHDPDPFAGRAQRLLHLGFGRREVIEHLSPYARVNVDSHRDSELIPTGEKIVGLCVALSLDQTQELPQVHNQSRLRTHEHEWIGASDLHAVFLPPEFSERVAEGIVRLLRHMVRLLKYPPQVRATDTLVGGKHQRMQQWGLIGPKRYCCPITFGRPAIEHLHPKHRSGRRARFSHGDNISESAVSGSRAHTTSHARR